jgi:hypothetical protein
VIGPPKWEKHLTTDEQGRVAVPTSPGLAAAFWKLPISKRERVAPEMTSSIATATLHHSRSCSGSGSHGTTDVNTNELLSDGILILALR